MCIEHITAMKHELGIRKTRDRDQVLSFTSYVSWTSYFNIDLFIITAK